MSSVSPADVLSILTGAESDWPALVGADWPKVEAQYRDLRAKVESATGLTKMRAAADLVQLFAPYARARERLHTAIAAQTEAGAMLNTLVDFASHLGLDASASVHLFREAIQPDSPQRFIVQNSPTEATSFKLGNFKLEFEGISALGVFVLTALGKEVFSQPNGFLVAAGVLAVIASLYKTVTVKLTEREATVFWGLARAPKQDDGTIIEEALLEHVNVARQSVGRESLTPMELRNALHELEKIKSVARIADQGEAWRIVEKHNV